MCPDNTMLCACGCNQPVPKPARGRHQNKYIKGHHPTAFRPLDERFWKHVNKLGPNDCWEWTGTRDKRGYGRVGIYKSRSERAHRVSWILTHGPIPEGLHVCHRCDNTSCVNPAHLFLGTHDSNMADKKRKSRQARHTGASNGRAKLTDAQVNEIRERYAAGNVTQRKLAEEFGVSNGHIHRLLNHVAWQHI